MGRLCNDIFFDINKWSHLQSGWCELLFWKPVMRMPEEKCTVSWAFQPERQSYSSLFFHRLKTQCTITVKQQLFKKQHVCSGNSIVSFFWSFFLIYPSLIKISTLFDIIYKSQQPLSNAYKTGRPRLWLAHSLIKTKWFLLTFHKHHKCNLSQNQLFLMGLTENVMSTTRNRGKITYENFLFMLSI